MTAAQIFQLVSLILGTSALSVGVQGWLGRKKTGAETSALLTEASSSMIADMRMQLTETQRLQRQTSESIRTFERALWEHRKWDTQVVKRLEQLGVEDITVPPELWFQP